MKKIFRSKYGETFWQWVGRQIYRLEGDSRILFGRKKYIVDRSVFPMPDAFSPWTDFRVGPNIYTCIFKFGKWMLVADATIYNPEFHAFKQEN